MGVKHQGSLSSRSHCADGVAEALRREVTCSKSHCIRGWARPPGDPWWGVTVVDPAALRRDRMANGIQYVLLA